MRVLVLACLVACGLCLPASACDQARAESSSRTVRASTTETAPAAAPDAKEGCGGRQGCCTPAQAGKGAEGDAPARPCGCGMKKPSRSGS